MSDQQAPQPAPSQEPNAPAQQPSQAAPAQQPASPWADSLGRAFPDEAVRGQVDQYLRSEIQPYVTRREQELGEVGNIWNDLWAEETTIPTYLSLAENIYGPEVARKLADTFAQHFEEQGMSPEAAKEAGAKAAGEQAAEQAADKGEPGQPGFEEWLAQAPPEVQELVMENVAQKEDKAYNSLVDQYAEQEPTIKGRTPLFSRYVVASDGDMDEALGLWRQEMAPVLKANPNLFLNGEQPSGPLPVEQRGAAPAERQQPDAVLGTGGAAPGGTTPPQIPQHQSMDDAMHDFLIDINGGRPDGRL